MLTVFNLVDANTTKLMPGIVDLLSHSPHISKFNGMSTDEIEKEVLRIHQSGGIVMVLVNAGANDGVVVLEKKNEIEATLVDLVLKEGYLPRGIDVFKSQIKRRIDREGFTQLFGNSDWYGSVKDPNISGLLVNG